MHISLIQLSIILFGSTFSISAFAQHAEQSSVHALEICTSNADYLKRTCKSYKQNHDKKNIYSAAFEDCGVIVKAEITYENVASSASPELGPHKLCTVKEYFTEIDPAKGPLTDKDGNPMLKSKTELFREFERTNGKKQWSDLTTEKLSVNSHENAQYLHSLDKGHIDCVTPNNGKEKCTWYRNSDSKNRYFDEIEIPSSEVRDKIRKGASLQDVVQMKKPVIPANKTNTATVITK